MASRSPSIASGSRPTRREFVIGGALGLTAVLGSTAFRPSSSKAPTTDGSLDKLFPESIGRWDHAPFADVFIPQAEKAEDNSYDALVTRYYQSDSAPGVMLLVAYSGSQAGGTELHRPEACYPVAGFKLHRWPNLALRLPGLSLPVRSITARAPGRTEQLLYWTRVGEDFPTNSLAQRWSAARQTFAGQDPDGVLVRMSVIDPDRGAAADLLMDFATELLRAAGRPLRRMLIGRA